MLNVNAIMSNSKGCTSSDSEHLVEVSASKIFDENDSLFIGTSDKQSVSCTEVLENCSEMPCTNHGVPDIEVHVYSSNLIADSNILEPESIVDEESKLNEFESIERSIYESSGVMYFNFNYEENNNMAEDDVFQDAVSFFNDSLSLDILENELSTVSSKSLVIRSSLFQMFDPLYAKSFANVKSNELQEAVEDEIKLEQDEQEKTLAFNNIKCVVQTDKLQGSSNTELIEIASSELQNDRISPDSNVSDLIFDIINNTSFNECLRQSLGNILTLDSKTIDDTDSHFENRNEKKYSEEELQKALKVKELEMLGTFLKKQKDLEEYFLRKQQDLESKYENQMSLTNSLCVILKESVDLVKSVSNREKVLKKRLEITEGEKNELKKDLDTFVEDLRNVNDRFCDFQKEYEQNKIVLELSIKNESLVQQLENMSMQLDRNEKICKDLHCRSQVILDKTNTKVAIKK